MAIFPDMRRNQSGFRRLTHDQRSLVYRCRMIRSRSKLPILWLILVILPAIAFLGCSLAKTRKHNDYVRTVAVLYGRAMGPAGEANNTIIAAIKYEDGRYEAEDYTSLEEQGSYLLIVPEGDYRLFSFIDRNHNRTFEAGEPSGVYDNGKIIEARQGEFDGEFNITINEDGSDTPTDWYGLNLPSKREHTFNKPPGVVADLDDEVFSNKFASLGYYSPTQFLYEIGGNIYFTQEYDPGKTPILFVHGAQGSPRDFKRFAVEMEKRGYQAWFVYWATGGRINRPATLLNKKLKDLQEKYHFNELHITAHSIGGLMVRSFLVNHGRSHPYIKTFTSIATPWGGVEAARLGVERSPVVLFNWQDVLPGSDFIRSIYSKKIPESIDHYLFFACLDYTVAGPEATDGTISLSSQLDPRAEAEAADIQGFQGDHEGVLSDELVFKKYLRLIRKK